MLTLLTNYHSYRNYSNFPYFEYVFLMKAVDPKLDTILLQMLNFNEVEKILTEASEYVLAFSPCQLLQMLKSISNRSPKLAQACSVIAKRFHEEMVTIQARFSNNEGKLTREDSTEIVSLFEHILCFFVDFHEDTYATFKKYLLIDLFLEIVLAAKPCVSSTVLNDNLAQKISVDLSRQTLFQNLCKDWSRCLSKFSQIDQVLHEELLSRFKRHVATIAPEGCFDVYLNDAGAHSVEISEMLFERAITLFQAKKETSYIGRFVDFGKYIFGSDSGVRAQNLARLFSRCVGDLHLEDKDFFDVVRSSTDLPSMSNMMKFFPKLLQLKLLDQGTVGKVNLILKHIVQVRVALPTYLYFHYLIIS